MRTRPKILVVDDSEIVLAAMRLLLESCGYDVHTSPTPFGTASTISREKPDLVLLDLIMPSLRGDAVVEMLRNSGGFRATRIVLLSDRPERELGDIARRCGADGFICKTLDHDAMVRQVQSWVSSAALTVSSVRRSTTTRWCVRCRA
ncbi:MAG: response regulator, partial [Clostridia bacterium]|nr:response regulator [Deltaproteobacteria bacterium]